MASTGDNTFGVFQVTDVMPAHTPTFQEYKSHVLDDFRDQQVTSLLARKTNELADRAHAEHDLAKAAKEVGATIKTSDLVGRDAQVTDKQQPSDADLAKSFDSTRDNLLNQRREQMFSVFASNLFSNYEKDQRILINRKLQQPGPLSGS